MSTFVFGVSASPSTGRVDGGASKHRSPPQPRVSLRETGRLDLWGSPTARVWKKPFDSTTTKVWRSCANLMKLGKIHLKRVKSWHWSMPNFSGWCSKVNEVYQKLPNSGGMSAYLKSLPTSSKKWIYHRAPKLMPKHSRYFPGFLKQFLRLIWTSSFRNTPMLCLDWLAHMCVGYQCSYG